jgi:hypothetical protein
MRSPQSSRYRDRNWDEPEVSARFSFTRPAAQVSQQAAELDWHRLTHALLAQAVKNGARTLVV